MLNPRNLTNGQEQYEAFKSSVTRKKAVQYDYRDTDGELFSCVKPTLEDCRAARDAWLQKKRGPATEEFDGHSADYCGSEEKMKMLTMPDYFPEQLPWDARRTILLEICGDVDDDMVINSTPELKDLPEYLKIRGSTIQRYSVEDYKKIAQVAMADINAEREDYEKLEYGVYLCELFTKTKVRMLTERINGNFKNVRFRLFREQVNGDIKDDCEVMIPTEDGNLVPFTFANNAARITAGLEIINTLSHHWGIEMPVIKDNAESAKKLLQDTQL